jgi:hypothetical protein
MYLFNKIKNEDVNTNVSVRRIDLGKAMAISFLSVKSCDSCDVLRISSFLWDAVEDALNSLVAKGFVESVNGCLTAVENQAKVIIKNDSSFVEQGLDINFSIVIVDGKKVSFGNLGENHIYLFSSANNEILHLGEMLAERKVSFASMIVDDIPLLAVTTSNIILGDHLTTSMDDFIKSLNKSVDAYETSAGVISVSELYDVEDMLSVDIVDDSGYSNNGSTFTEDNVKGDERDDGVNGLISKKDNEIDKESDSATESLQDNSRLAGVVSDVNGKQTNYYAKLKSFVSLSIIKLKALSVGRRRNLNVKSTGNVDASPLDNVINFISKVINIIVDTFEQIADKLFGQTSWMKRWKAKRSARNLDLSRFRVGGYKTRDSRNKGIAYVVLSVIVLFLIFKGWQSFKQWQNDKVAKQTFTEEITQLEDEYEVIKGSYASDKITAEKKITEALSLLDKYTDEDFLSMADEAKVESLRGKFVEIENKILKKTVVSTGSRLQLVVEAKLSLDSQSQPSDMILRRGDNSMYTVFLVDSGAKKLFKIDTQSWKPQIISDPNALIVDPMFVDWGNYGVYVYDGVNGVLVSSFADGDKNLPVSQVSGLDADAFNLNSPADLAILNDDYINLLDTRSGTVVRAVRYSSGSYGLPAEYFSDDKLTEASDLLADLYVYALNKDLGIVRFTKGSTGMVEYPMQVTDLFGGLGDLTCATTGFDLNKNFYIWDQSQKRVLVFEKPIESGTNTRHPGKLLFVRQYEFDVNENELTNIKDLAVTEDESILYLLDSTGVWSFEL